MFSCRDWMKNLYQILRDREHTNNKQLLMHLKLNFKICFRVVIVRLIKSLYAILLKSGLFLSWQEKPKNCFLCAMALWELLASSQRLTSVSSLNASLYWNYGNLIDAFKMQVRVWMIDVLIWNVNINKYKLNKGGRKKKERNATWAYMLRRKNSICKTYAWKGVGWNIHLSSPILLITFICFQPCSTSALMTIYLP